MTHSVTNFLQSHPWVEQVHLDTSGGQHTLYIVVKQDNLGRMRSVLEDFGKANGLFENAHVTLLGSDELKEEQPPQVGRVVSMLELSDRRFNFRYISRVSFEEAIKGSSTPLDSRQKKALNIANIEQGLAIKTREIKSAPKKKTMVELDLTCLANESHLNHCARLMREAPAIVRSNLAIVLSDVPNTLTDETLYTLTKFGKRIIDDVYIALTPEQYLKFHISVWRSQLKGVAIKMDNGPSRKTASPVVEKVLQLHAKNLIEIEIYTLHYEPAELAKIEPLAHALPMFASRRWQCSV